MNQEAVKNLPAEVQIQAAKQKGYSIVELSIALAIISIILVTSLAGVQRVLRTNNVNNDLRHINLTVGALTALTANQSSTSGVSMANLVNLKVFDGFTVTGTSTVTNAFGGDIKVFPNKAQVDSYPAATGFMVYSQNIPSEACADYINGLSNLSPNISTSNVSSVVIDGAVLGTAVKSAGGSYSIATLATACAVSTTNPKITIAAFVGKI
jgi:prepilin-type N-terminal cleavage/methylation domain-containing protein